VTPTVIAGDWRTRDAEATEALGAALLGRRQEGIAPCLIVELTGDLGAGKSTFARGALRALGVTGPIKSPSYTLVETYELPRLTCVHLDLYRLQDANELEHLGLADYHRANHLWLIEWPERGAGRLPAPDLRVRFVIEEGAHHVTATALTSAGEERLRESENPRD
jgi:tRNA threonylcarbamoyladenosine biosynthesis protein TsaE